MGDNDTKNNIPHSNEEAFASEIKKPEDIVRLFYIYNVPILPVITKQGILYGILKKEDVVAELSDIARSTVTIDEFIQKLAKKMTMDEILPLVTNVQQLIAIDLFGDVQKTMSRLELFMAAEGQYVKDDKRIEQTEVSSYDSSIEWLIYLVLEHIPRALYAVNERGKTFFYNGHFEDIYFEAYPGSSEVDRTHVECILADSEKNDIYTTSSKKRQLFYNRELKAYYEKVPLQSDGKTCGYLYMFDTDIAQNEFLLPDIIERSDGLDEILSKFERALIVNTLVQTEYNVNKTAKLLNIPVHDLKYKLKQYNIQLNSRGDKQT